MADDVHEEPASAGSVLANNIKRIREELRLTFVALSEHLEEVGRPIPVLGLRRIERGERRVDVEDLLALSCVLRVAPVDLLVPNTMDDSTVFSLAPGVLTTAGRAREWIAGTGYLDPPETPLEFAEAIRWMPRARAQDAARRYLTPERQREWNTAAFEYDRRLHGDEEDEGGRPDQEG